MLIVIKKTYPINMNYSKIIKQFLSLKIFVLTLYAPIILAANFCPVDKPDPATYTWTEVKSHTSDGFPGRFAHASVAFEVAGDKDGKKMWIIGGSGGSKIIIANDVWSSTNGATWTEVKSNDLAAPDTKGFSPRARHASVVFDNRMWVIGGDFGSSRFNDVWSSTDGVTWTTATDAAAFSARSYHTAVAFDVADDNEGEKMWVIGGTRGGNEVWSSTNGATWIEETKDSSAKFSARHSHTSVVFDDKMWVIGGNNGSSRLNDVWKSTNGVTWTTATDSAVFSVRSAHTSVVFDDGSGEKMWVIGGTTDGDYKNEVWSSYDGITWTYEINTEKFVARHEHTSVVFDEKVWVIGGQTINTGLENGYHNDVWSRVKE
jgi:dihydrofolate reductase